MNTDLPVQYAKSDDNSFLEFDKIITPDISKEDLLNIYEHLLAKYKSLLKEPISINNDLNEQIEELTNKLNISERKLRDSMTFVTRLSEIIAQRLKTQFSSLSGTTGLLYNELNNFTLSEIAEFTNHINRSANSIHNLIDNVIVWLEINSGKIELNPNRITLHQFVDELYSSFEKNAKEKSIRLINNTDHDISLYADPELIRSVFSNLLSNAIKFSEEEGEISVSSVVYDSSVKVIVADTGSGMDEKMVETLFRADFRGNGSEADFERRNGLGLILSKEIIEKSGGNIWCESSPGKGTKILFTVPLYSEPV